MNFDYFCKDSAEPVSYKVEAGSNEGLEIRIV